MQVSSQATVKIEPFAFQKNEETAIYWLGSAGVLINSHGTTILIDPVLDQIELNGQFYSEIEGLKMFQSVPLHAGDIPKVDAILYTHADTDHIGLESFKILGKMGATIHCPHFVKRHFMEHGLEGNQIVAHEKLATFYINDIKVDMTLADHPWHKSKPHLYDFYYKEDDCTGFKLTTRDGVMWNPGDTLLLDEHLREGPIDLLFIDFSDDPFHFGLDGARQLANLNSNAVLIPIHWGTYDSEKPCFNANPYEQVREITNNERLNILAIGEKYIMGK